MSKKHVPTGPGPQEIPARAILAGVSPQDREKFSRWLEAQATNKQNVIAFEEDWLKNHPDDEASSNQLLHWQKYVSVCQHLAWLVRANRRGKPTE